MSEYNAQIIRDSLLKVMPEIPLSGDLAYWRAERPDEWTMDRFITHAELLENIIQAIANEADYIANIKPKDDEVYFVNTEYLQTLTSMGLAFGRHRIKEAMEKFDDGKVYWRGCCRNDSEEN
jgi:hypothetical protein